MRKGSLALAAGLAALTLLPAIHSASAARRPAAALKVKKRTVSPTALAGGGGDVFVRVQVSKPRAQITLVRAQGQIPGQGAGAAVTLLRRKNLYEGTVRVPANLSGAPAQASLNLLVSSTAGEEPAYRLTTVPVGPGGSGGPPPPPSYR